MPSYTNKGPSFSKEDFVHAFTDKLQWFDFFKNHVIGIAVNKGVKGMELNDVAIDVLYEIYQELNKFDPNRANFKTFFVLMAKSRIVDKLRRFSSGTDIMSGPHYTKRSSNRDNEISKPYRADYDEVSQHPNQFSDEEDAILLKKKEFTEGLLQECINYFDSLDPEERLIVYSSEFGKLLRNEEPQKDYAQALANKNGRTVESIRKIASRQKKNAIEYAQSRGYDSRAFNSIFMGFLTTEPPSTEQPVEINWDALTEMEVLLLRRHIYEKAVSEGFPVAMIR